jgi:hypothetical protein
VEGISKRRSDASSHSSVSGRGRRRGSLRILSFLTSDPKCDVTVPALNAPWNTFWAPVQQLQPSVAFRHPTMNFSLFFYTQKLNENLKFSANSALNCIYVRVVVLDMKYPEERTHNCNFRGNILESVPTEYFDKFFVTIII